MDTILDNFASDKLFPNSNLLDLEDLNESDFLSNVVRQSSISMNSGRERTCAESVLSFKYFFIPFPVLILWHYNLILSYKVRNMYYIFVIMTMLLLHTHTHTHIHTRIYFIYIYIYIYMYVCVCVYACVYVQPMYVCIFEGVCSVYLCLFVTHVWDALLQIKHKQGQEFSSCEVCPAAHG